jgi:hypothetical protein
LCQVANGMVLIFNFYNYISQWIDAIDVVIGSVKKLWMLLLCLDWWVDVGVAREDFQDLLSRQNGTRCRQKKTLTSAPRLLSFDTKVS